MLRRPASDIDRELGRNIRAYRQLRGMTQAELGRAVGVSGQQIEKNESGRNKVSASRLLEIAVVLDVPPCKLLDITADRVG